MIFLDLDLGSVVKITSQEELESLIKILHKKGYTMRSGRCVNELHLGVQLYFIKYGKAYLKKYGEAYIKLDNKRVSYFGITDIYPRIPISFKEFVSRINNF